MTKICETYYKSSLTFKKRYRMSVDDEEQVWTDDLENDDTHEGSLLGVDWVVSWLKGIKTEHHLQKTWLMNRSVKRKTICFDVYYRVGKNETIPLSYYAPEKRAIISHHYNDYYVFSGVNTRGEIPIFHTDCTGWKGRQERRLPLMPLNHEHDGVTLRYEQVVDPFEEVVFYEWFLSSESLNALETDHFHYFHRLSKY
ncbi:hypothetical protein [Texcoconibacillus texcoconensis]|uniref:Uncharacterized protein n=1 Tax=Texcoconibacillus texcoconensis TaxID=1095777 RepID=A0A840QP34_9BACI|nr:hypothetical protein [Texcoconibacillus texcoconensis]MBB5173134.1 hypothetical protein [Texcoconibacillus texcoconensis]